MSGLFIFIHFYPTIFLFFIHCLFIIFYFICLLCVYYDYQFSVFMNLLSIAMSWSVSFAISGNFLFLFVSSSSDVLVFYLTTFCVINIHIHINIHINIHWEFVS